MNKLLILLLTFVIWKAEAQLIRTEPAFPSQFDDVTVYFDASKGDGGLAGFTGDVYAHTGVITNESNSPTDWKNVQGQWGIEFPKTLMTAEGNDIYSISFNIMDFYGISDGTTVEQLAFVFRNVDGSVTGRAEGGGDIFTPVYPPDEGLLLTVFSPEQAGAIIYEDDSLFVQFALNTKAMVSVLDNDIVVYSDSTESVSFFIKEPLAGAHQLEFIVTNEIDSLSLFRNYFVLQRNEEAIDPPLEMPMGLSYFTDSTYYFQLFAPEKEHVFLLTPSNSYNVDLEYKMNRSSDRSTFWIELDTSLFTGGRNTYQYLIDGRIKIADPFSTVVLDPANDPFVPEEVLRELPPYPEGKTNGIVTAFDLDNDDFPWTDFAMYEIPEQTNIVVYELLMRDFLDDKNYASLLDTLDYLEDLGVTAIELMPVNEFEGNQSWGYNPSYHMALDKYYGSRRQLKMVVNEAHSRGIAVILDVVYNHVFSQSPLAQMYWDGANFRPTEDSPYLNVTARHPFNVGYDVNHESAATKAWVKQTLGYWMTEFHIDGFRFDLSKGFTQTNSGNDAGLMSRYDAGRIAILKDYADYIWSINPDVYVILEHFADNDEEKELANYGMMLWGNMHFQFLRATKEQSSDLEWLDYKVREWDHPHVVGYMESHDEERIVVDLENTGFSLDEALEKVETASTILYLVPGPKMFWQFGELGFDYSINWCVNGSVNNNCRLDPKPVVWNYLEDEERLELRDVVANILDLKKNYPTFSSDDYEFNDGNLYLKTIHFNHEEMDAVVMANFRDVTGNLNPKFQYEGVWYEYFSGDSLVVEDTQEKIPLQSGEYRIYTSERITPVRGFTSSVEDLAEANIEIWPNPARAGQRLYISGDIDVQELWMVDQLGRNVLYSDHVSGFRVPTDMPSGVYYLRISDGERVGVSRLVVE
ncbi:alpha-amylase family glycosyl hydrolase [Portibacter marinus]|uniref:alpha-amylase family glycosyl hydrolase n=1 Tax=Portibacter marinus TaxID=2898660 RepID=UPI001F178596|nr:alpha-amylase family glycosyl hydrolase [Portibacter marinus]